jgi:hypothetical protein
MIDLPYSRAERCPRCGERAILTEREADSLAVASGGRLEPFLCLDGVTYHVWNPNFERTRGRR